MMKRFLLLLIILIVPTGCAGIPSYKDSPFTLRNQDPGFGVLVNKGKAQLDIDLYRYDPIPREYYLLKSIHMEPAFMNSENELWFRLVPGKYQLVVYPYVGRWKFKKALKRREYYLEIDEDPTDGVYRGKYVGWVKKIRINQ